MTAEPPFHQSGSIRGLTSAQRDMLDDIARTGEPEGGRGWTPHSQRRLDSLVRRGLVKYEGDGRWELAEEHVPEDAEAKRWWEEDEELWT